MRRSPLDANSWRRAMAGSRVEASFSMSLGSSVKKSRLMATLAAPRCFLTVFTSSPASKSLSRSSPFLNFSTSAMGSGSLRKCLSATREMMHRCGEVKRWAVHSSRTPSLICTISFYFSSISFYRSCLRISIDYNLIQLDN
jgi:hypothetical protein